MKVIVVVITGMMIFLANPVFADWIDGPGKWLTENIAKESINVLGVHNVVRYKPKRRVIKVCKTENTLIVDYCHNERPYLYIKKENTKRISYCCI